MPFSFGKLRVLLLLTCTLTRSIYRNVLFKIYILFDMSNSRNFVVGNIAQVRKSPMRGNDTIFLTTELCGLCNFARTDLGHDRYLELIWK